MAKWLVIGDLHFGEKNDSDEFNNDVLDFLGYASDYAMGKGVTKCCQVGDYYHQRHKINVSTLNYGIVGASILMESFGKENVYVLAGNHCLYYRDRLDMSSLAAIAPYVTVIDKPTSVSSILMTPWIVDAEQWDGIVNAAASHRFLFAHLELKGFKMNENYVMEHGHSHKELRDYEKVITGHYHTFQEKENIIYTGTPYPISMNEANQDHYFFIFDDDSGELEKVVYDEIKVVSIPYDQIEQLEGLDPTKTTVRIEFPDDLEDESLITEVQGILSDMKFSEVKIKYRGEKAKQIAEADVGEIEEVDNIDELVLNVIKGSTDIEGIDKAILESIYRESIQRGVEQ